MPSSFAFNHKTANEDSLASTEKTELGQTIENLNQRVRLRKGCRGKPRKARRHHDKDKVMIFVYICLNNNYLVSFHPCFDHDVRHTNLALLPMVYRDLFARSLYFGSTDAKEAIQLIKERLK